MNPLKNVAAVSILCAAYSVGCGNDAPAPSGQEQATTAALVEGTPEAIGAARFLNDAATTVAVLDDDVPLPSHAAKNLIAHRDGPDGLHGTSDDDAFDDVNEILDVPQIGMSRLNALVAYAEASGFVPSGADHLGDYDDVAFSADEAAATLQLVNSASATELDDDIALDKRAVESILEARPIATVLELSTLYYVGASALTKLKAWSSSGTLADVGEDCSKHADCMGTMRCEGIPYDGSPAIGRCIPQGNVEGAEEDCSSDADCLGDLLCSGLTIYNSGYCRPSWMFGTYTSTDVSAPIPDNDPAGASMSVVVYGLASVPEDIMVTIDLDHPRPQDLVVTLVSTNGSDSLLWNNDSSPAFYLPALGIERDNEVNAMLTLEVVDTVSGETGVLNGFEVWVSSRYD
jgi:Proprotein convertase P-domain